MITLKINGKAHQIDASPDTPLLWAIRDIVGLTGTKFGCGVGACGACTVHVNGQATRTCITPVDGLEGAEITTIEALGEGHGGHLHPVQKAWIDVDVPQCGYCQSGMIMAVAALLKSNPHPTDAEIDEQITNICRCGTYARIREAIHQAARGARS